MKWKIQFLGGMATVGVLHSRVYPLGNTALDWPFEVRMRENLRSRKVKMWSYFRESLSGPACNLYLIRSPQKVSEIRAVEEERTSRRRKSNWSRLAPATAYRFLI